MAHIVLIQPELAFEAGYPLGLAYSAAALKSVGHRVTGIDLRLSSRISALRRIAVMRPAVVGVSVCTRNREAAFTIAGEVAARCAIPVVLGGPHATLCPDECLAQEGVSGVVRGEGEGVFPLIVDAICEHRPIAAPGWMTRGP